MRWLASIGFHLQTLFRKRKLDAQLSEEVRMHLEMATEANIAEGMTPEAARRAALREFGNVAGFQERTRDERGWGWLEQIGKDFAFAGRALLHARGFAVAMIATLSLGLGAAVLVFLFVDPVLFRPLPYRDTERLIAIGDAQNDPHWPFCFPIQLQAYREQTHAFSETATARLEEKNIVLNGAPVATSLTLVSPEFFQTLGISIDVGRTFLPAEHNRGVDDVVIISDRLWRKCFARNPSALGRTILVDGRPCVVVGVLPARFARHVLLNSDVLRPHRFTPEPNNPLNGGHFAIGRLRPGVSATQAVAELDAVKIDIHPTYAAYFAERRPRLFTLHEGQRPHVMWLMVGAGGSLLAIATMNATNLMLVRLASRRRELSVRQALGASHWQLRRLVLAEIFFILVFVAGGLLAYARWLYPATYTWLIGFPFDVDDYGLTGRVVTLVVSLVALAGMAVAVVPMRKMAGNDFHDGLKLGGNQFGQSRRGSRLRNTLVVLQAVFAVILLSGAGLMMETLRKLQAIDVGFDPRLMVNVRLKFAQSVGTDWETRVQLLNRVRDSLAALPGVTKTAFGSRVLLQGGFAGILGMKMPDGTLVSIQPDPVSADFADTAGLHLAAGRWLSGLRGQNEVVINETLARKRFGSGAPVGEFIEVPIGRGLNEAWQVVGVVRDLREAPRQPPGAHVYFPEWFVPLLMDTVVLRFHEVPSPELTDLVKRAVYETDPRIMAADALPVHDRMHQLLVIEKSAFAYLRLFSGTALVLAVLGLYSVLAYTVRQRRTEIGVRSALGATPANLAAMVIKQGTTLTAIGVASGITVALGLTRFMQSLLYETAPHDPWVFLGVAGLLLFVAAIACWVPAQSAAQVDPAVALRSE